MVEQKDYTLGSAVSTIGHSPMLPPYYMKQTEFELFVDTTLIRSLRKLSSVHKIEIR